MNNFQKICALGLAVLFVLGMSFSGIGSWLEAETAKAQISVEKVTIVQTDHFVTFMLDDQYIEHGWTPAIKTAQEAAEQWIQVHPDYEVLDSSTALNKYAVMTFSITLRIKKR